MSNQAQLAIDVDCCGVSAMKSMDDEAAADLASAFKALGDPIRLRLLSMIAQRGGEVCVCEMTPEFDVSGATVSHHLKALRSAGLVDCQRRGTWVYYWIIPSRMAQLSALLDPFADKESATRA